MLNATIDADGFGSFPSIGDFVYCNGNAYRVVSINETIHTGVGRSNYIYANIESVDWSDITDKQADSITNFAKIKEEKCD